MKRNLILVAALILTLFIVYSSVKRISNFRSTAKSVAERQQYLEELRIKNEQLRKDLEYKEGSQFAELEIRNKLGLAKPGETVVIVPKEEDKGLKTKDESKNNKPNWEKWKELFFGV